MRRLLFIAFALALLAPTAAQAGGWATVTISSTPRGVDPGRPWVVDMTVKQHGETPMEGITPAMVVRFPDGAEHRFAGVATDTPGVYRATVVFPEAARYSYRVDDGFTNAIEHDFGPVQIGSPAAPAAATADPGGFPWWIAAVAVALLGLAYAWRQRALSFSRRVVKKGASQTGHRGASV